jgi:hypothetical protein
MIHATHGNTELLALQVLSRESIDEQSAVGEEHTKAA